MAGATSAGPSGPCDIFATGNTPCVAAHSTVRLLASTYSGPLYQVRRASDGKTQDIAFLAQSGAADSAAQETFCTGTTCTISVIYDQSGKSNHLKRSPGGGQVCQHQDLEAVADALPLTLGGHKVYGIKVVSDNSGPCTPPPGGEGTGYRLDQTTDIATGDDAETEYMITSGTTQAYGNSGCCFDYGNVETNNEDDGAATMESIYFGGGAGWGHGGGSGPWVMADMENGIFSGSTSAYTGNTSVPYAYVTAVLIGRTGGTYALMAGNAQTGNLTTMYDGARPSGYTKMKKQGAIVLGTGGDNSDHGQGYFFEGVMTAGAATAAVMNLIQANILAAGYGK
ncbi:MAG TPA: arabinofuranosidase catalytic domain-containing protein [Polyangia bacterium]|nr:arabinofuranosidase catalytic domain-containing protein [Polyangia bacterium]